MILLQAPELKVLLFLMWEDSRQEECRIHGSTDRNLNLPQYLFNSALCRGSSELFQQV